MGAIDVYMAQKRQHVKWLPTPGNSRKLYLESGARAKIFYRRQCPDHKGRWRDGRSMGKEACKQASKKQTIRPAKKQASKKESMHASMTTS